MDFAPAEMFAPVIPPWVKKRDAASGFRIDRVCLCSFRKEHETHARQRFARVVFPPCLMGKTWSM